MAEHPTQSTFIWHEILTRDPEGAKEFYAKLLGWTSTGMTLESGQPYTMFSNGEADVGGIVSMEGPDFEGVPPHWVVYISVDDVDEKARQAEALGGKIFRPPADIPGIGRVAVIADPEGATFCIFKLFQAANPLPRHRKARPCAIPSWPRRGTWRDTPQGIQPCSMIPAISR